MSFLEDWNMRHFGRYCEQFKRGEHDRECEQRERSSLCHCAKRKRLNDGRIEPPTISFRAPDCDGCDREVEFDGDRFWCPNCNVSWSTSATDGDQGEWQDDYGTEPFGGAQFGERLIVKATRVAS